MPLLKEWIWQSSGRQPPRTCSLILLVSINGCQTPSQGKLECEQKLWWRFDMLMKLEKEYALSMDVTLVKSKQNKAYWLMRVPQRWIDLIRRNTELIQPAWIESVRSVGSDQIRTIHQQSGYPSVGLMHYFVKQIDPWVQGGCEKYWQGMWGVSVNWPVTSALTIGCPEYWRDMALDSDWYYSS